MSGPAIVFRPLELTPMHPTHALLNSLSRRGGTLLALSLVALSGCKGGAALPKPPTDDEMKVAINGPAPIRVVALGDSITAGYGLTTEQAYPALVEKRLRDEGFNVDVVNGGVSGDTTAGGLRRLDWALGDSTSVLIVALGGNDALRGLSIDDMRRNLGAIVEQAQQRGVTVILAGMEAPPNLGQDYTAKYRTVFPEISARYRVKFLPFLLQGVAGVPELNQADGIHPTAEGARKVADLLYPLVEQAVRARETQ
jgi:acyl-CoA thioesterase-1